MPSGRNVVYPPCTHFRCGAFPAGPPLSTLPGNNAPRPPPRLSYGPLRRIVVRTYHRSPAMNQQLTPQETEILKLVRDGRTSKQIARQIGVNYHVVNRRVLRIRRVLGARNRLHLCTMAADGELQ